MLGRSAWTTMGKDNGMTMYARLRDKPRDGVIKMGATEEELGWYKAVNYGVLAIQRRLMSEGLDFTEPNGIYGWFTRSSVKRYQQAHNLVSDGIVGQQTMKELLRPVISIYSEKLNINPKFIYGLARQESALDPGAQGRSTPGDLGIWQFNTLLDVRAEDATDIPWAAKAVCNRWTASREKYKGKGDSLRIDCCIMQHRSPLAADYLFQHGVPYGPESSAYVQSVHQFADTWS